MPKKSNEQKDYEKVVAKKITHFRKKVLKISQSKFAEETGISYSVIRQRETFDTAYNIYDVARISDAYDVDVDYLLDRQDEPHRETKEIKNLTALTHCASDILRENVTQRNWFDVALHSWIIEQLDDDIINDLYALIYLEERAEYAKIGNREEEIIFNSKDLIKYIISNRLNRLLHGFENTFRKYFEEHGYSQMTTDDLFNSFDDESEGAK